MSVRSPIITVMGHIDAGKTTLLDRIRGTMVAAHEAGAITQWAGCSFMTSSCIKQLCLKYVEKLKIDIKIPGFLFLDTPGHAAFNAIRKRGGSLADLAILVIDVNIGFQAQTEECISILKQYKTPFVIAATKLDKIDGWQKKSDCFLESYEQQSDKARANLEDKVYKIVSQMYEHGFSAERFDRVTDFRKSVAIIPVSSTTGEGMPELLMTLIGLSQTFLKDQIEIKSDVGLGTILEVKELRGCKTIDVILYDGKARVGDWLVIGAKEPIVTKIRAILVPRPGKEIRVEKEFENAQEVSAAAGIKIMAPDIENAIAGSPVAILGDEAQIEKYKKELSTEIEGIEFDNPEDGVMLKADSLGSLEALVGIVKEKGISIRAAHVGNVNKNDVIAMTSVKEPLKRFILVFGLQPDEEVLKIAKDNNVPIVSSNIIYDLFEKFEKMLEEKKSEIREAKLAQITRPVQIKILPGCIFRASDPAIVGVEVLDGILRSGIKMKKDRKEVGTILAIQSEGMHVDIAKKGERVAVSIEGPVVGRHIFENDILSSVITQQDVKVLEELELRDEAELARRILGADNG